MITPHFHIGGPLHDDALYVIRSADAELPAALEAGELCHVVAPSQIGKSSLMVRTANRLRTRGVRCAQIDLQEIGSVSTPEVWFFSLAQLIADAVGSGVEAASLWRRTEGLSPVVRWMSFVREQLIAGSGPALVVFMDEIGMLLASPAIAADFLGSIQALQEKRAQDAAYRRLTFCLLGFTPLGELIEEPAARSFDAGRSVALGDFSFEEASMLLPGLNRTHEDPETLLRAVLAWTDGHPYMTQRVCKALTEGGSGGGGLAARVERTVNEVFPGRAWEDSNLHAADTYLSKTNERAPVKEMLYLYRRLLEGGQVDSDPDSSVELHLRLSGMAAVRFDGEKRRLRVRNAIFARVFDRRWLEDREAQLLQQEPLRLWLAANPDARGDLLLRGSALEEALLKWSSPSTAEDAFLRESQKRAAQEAAQIRLREEARVAEERARVAEEHARELARALDAERGVRASVLAGRGGQEIDALVLGVLAVGRESQRPELAPLAAVEGLAAGVLAARRSYPLRGHSGDVFSAVFSPDGQSIATVSFDKTARIWDASSGEVRATLRGHTGFLWTVGFSPDSAVIVTGGDDGQARLWSARDGELLAVLGAPAKSVRTAAFSPDGRRLITANFDPLPRLWDHQGSPIAVLEGHQKGVSWAAFSPDGARVVTASDDGTARIWSAETGAPLVELRGHTRHVRHAVFSPDGACVLSASDDQTARVWGLDGHLLGTLDGHEGRVLTAIFSPDGVRVVTASADHTARIWDASTRALLATLRGHTDSLAQARFSPDGARVVTAGLDRTVRLWGAQNGLPLAILEGHSKEVWMATFSPDSARILSASRDETARLWEPDAASAATLRGHNGCVNILSSSPNGAWVLSGGDDGTGRVWEARTGRLHLTLPGHRKLIRAASFSPDGERMLTAGGDSAARLWAASGELLAVLEGHQNAILAASFSPNGRFIVTAGDGTARLWDGRNGTLRSVLTGHSLGIHRAVFSPSGAQVATSGADGTLRIWSVPDGDLLATLGGHTEKTNSVAFSPDGAHVITASDDKTARLWNAHDGTPGLILHGHADWVYGAAFSPDSARVITAGEDGTARIWDACSGSPIRTLSGHADRVHSAVFSSDGAHVVTASDDLTARLWDARSGGQIAVFPHRGAVLCAAFSPDGSHVLSSGYGGIGRIDFATADGFLAMASRLLRHQPEFAEVEAICRSYVGTSTP